MKNKKKNLINDIIENLKIHKLNTVSIFGCDSCITKSVSASLALAKFLKQIDIPCNVIVKNKEELTIEDDLIQDAPLSEHFMAISIDAKTVDAIENDSYKYSNLLLNVYGPAINKGYGVINYVQKEVNGAAEILYQEINTYCEQENIIFPADTATYLYLSILAGTKQFSFGVKKNTFLITRELLNKGTNYKDAYYMFVKKPEAVLKCQELILRSMKQADGIAYTIINEALAHPYKIIDFKNALDGFRNIGNIAVWVVFIQYKNQYHVLFQSDSTYRYNVAKPAKKNGGDGNPSDGYALIQSFDISKVLDDVKLMISQNGEMWCNDEEDF